MKNWILKKLFFFSIAVVLGSILFPGAGAESSGLPDPMVKFRTLRETVELLLPNAAFLSRRDITLESSHLKALESLKNWDTDITDFVIYHSKNKGKKIVRTLILFPEHTRQGTVLVAVALDNHGIVTGTVLMEAQRPAVNHLLPLLRAGYMDIFAGGDRKMKLQLPPKYQSREFPPITRTYALRIANAVKKGAQMFRVYFKRK